MPKIRVLIVDDAVVIRRMLSDVLAQDPGIEVAGAAANGQIAVAKLDQVNPDVIILDVEMPEMDGLQTLKAIRLLRPTLPVIMFSMLTERGALTTLEALSLGATDYITKPANVGSAALACQRVRDDLVPRIKALCRGPGISAAAPAARQPVIRRAVAPASEAAVAAPELDIVAIGVSTGGPNALASLIPQLPRDFPVPIVIVQHMPPLFTKFLADRLTALGEVKVEEGRPGAVLTPGAVWIAPGDWHMTVERSAGGAVIGTNQGPPEHSCRPAVDVLFRSAVAAYGSRVLAVVLTGMGQDGLRGCELVHEAGGQVIVQDEATSVVWGMPGYVAQAGLAQRVLPLDQIAPDMIRRTLRSSATGARP
jgi:two-component system chemotaxis response regulator CheB